MTLICLLPNWVENWLTWLQLCSSQRRQENTLVKILMNTEITLESLDPHGLSPLKRAGGGGEGGWDCFVDVCQCCLLSRFFPQSPPTPSPSHCTPSTSSNSALPPPPPQQVKQPWDWISYVFCVKYIPHFVYPCICWWTLDWFHLLAIMNNAVMNWSVQIIVQIPVFKYLWFMP